MLGLLSSAATSRMSAGTVESFISHCATSSCTARNSHAAVWLRRQMPFYTSSVTTWTRICGGGAEMGGARSPAHLPAVVLSSSDHVVTSMGGLRALCCLFDFYLANCSLRPWRKSTEALGFQVMTSTDLSCQTRLPCLRYQVAPNMSQTRKSQGTRHPEFQSSRLWSS